MATKHSYMTCLHKQMVVLRPVACSAMVVKMSYNPRGVSWQRTFVLLDLSDRTLAREEYHGH